MTHNIQTNGIHPAFAMNLGRGISQPGLTKREYFAAMAMQGMVTRNEGTWDLKARWAVDAADALIAALNQENK